MELNREQITTLLHHRAPYLMVDRVSGMDERKIIAKRTFTEEDFFLNGHFPGAPVIPGAIMQEMTTQAAGILLTMYYAPVENYDSDKTKGHAIGVLSRVHYGKYLNFAKPNQELTITAELIEKLDSRFKFKAKITRGNDVIMKNSFTLMNISDDYLF
jgi:3-hydroxyacyl-[acyl-carrier-protein] dehydratase